ncbi:MAG: HAMP domain-containing sensor histidine kinase, partial [Gemmatimonadota bacterium]
ENINPRPQAAAENRYLPRPVSLRSELLVSIGVVAAAALFLGVASVVVLYGVLDPQYAAVYMGVLIAVDVVVFVAYAAYQVNRVVVRPLSEAVDAAEAIAGGDLTRRIPHANSQELTNLADSVNRMTDRLIEDRVHLVRAEKMASIGRLAAGVAHEVGNPLGAINGYAHVLRASATSPEGRDALAGLEREAARIDRIVRGLLDYARPSARFSGIVDIGDVAKNVVELLISQGVLKTVELRFSPASQPLLVAGDRHDLEQMYINLLLNAVDAMRNSGALSLIVRKTSREALLSGGRRETDPSSRPPTPPSARAVRWLDERPARDVAMIAVVDSGPGIPEEDLERVFEPFYTTKEPGKGTGLGLAIVARAVENASGTIWVTRSREGGAAFRILLPMATA